MAGEAEREEILVSNVVECVGTLMKAHHSAYLPVFEEQMAQIVMAMMQPAALDSDRSAALCVFDDLIEHCSADGGAQRYVASRTLTLTITLTITLTLTPTLTLTLTLTLTPTLTRTL